MPHSESLKMLNMMDFIRQTNNIVFPGENDLEIVSAIPEAPMQEEVVASEAPIQEKADTSDTPEGTETTEICEEK
jgi:hypothetical protein